MANRKTLVALWWLHLFGLGSVNVVGKQGIESTNKLVNSQFSPFAEQFLIECLGRTAFARICANKIRSVFKKEGFGDPITAYSLPTKIPRPDTSLEERTRCVYLDGLEALKAKAPLSEKK